MIDDENWRNSQSVNIVDVSNLDGAERREPEAEEQRENDAEEETRARHNTGGGGKIPYHQLEWKYGPPQECDDLVYGFSIENKSKLESFVGKLELNIRPGYER